MACEICGEPIAHPWQMPCFKTVENNGSGFALTTKVSQESIDLCDDCLLKVAMVQLGSTTGRTYINNLDYYIQRFDPEIFIDHPLPHGTYRKGETNG